MRAIGIGAALVPSGLSRRQDALALALRDELDPDDRALVAHVLGLLGPAASEATIAALVTALSSDPDAQVRAEAATALDLIGGARFGRGRC
jgi:HEAT repeat protein